MKSSIASAIICITTFVIVSCAKYTVVNVSSPTVNPKSKEFVYENDSLKVTYNLWGKGGAMNFDIYNKLSTPLYFDWKRSAYIPNNKMLSYWQDETNTEGTTTTTTGYSLYLPMAVSTSKSKSKSVRQERVGVIPPKASISLQKYLLLPPTLVSDYGLRATNTAFSETTSPFKFRNYLTVSTNEQFTDNVFTLDNEFYVDSTETLVQKAALKKQASNKFYIY